MNISQGLACRLSLVVFIACPIFGQNQGYKFHSLTVSSGQSTITSGITGIVQFTKGDTRLIEIALQQEQTWIIYGRRFKSSKTVNSFASCSVGQFRGAPWVGPFLTLDKAVAKIAGQQITIGTMQWPWLFLWRPLGWEHRSPNTNFLPGYLGTAQLTIGPVGLAYSKEKFLDNSWNDLPAISYNRSIHKDFSVSGSATWNNNDKYWMFYVGVVWKPSN